MYRLKSYDTQNMYKKVLKKDRICDEKTFSKVIKTYFKNMTDALFELSTAYLPYGMGILRTFVVDLTPYFDVKTGKVYGGYKKPLFGVDSHNRIIKVAYYKCKLPYNPMRFCKFKQSEYMQHKKYEIYLNRDYNKFITKKI